VPAPVLDRLRHYFLTYKDMPGHQEKCEITDIYNKKTAFEVIKAAVADYKEFINKLLFD
ncbi:MAG TPA: inorganic pyrophosphatase, partial [Saprospiraceae bacterium]|nr:inorganic pyrophosphatase [Saprospiraceae bacterium]